MQALRDSELVKLVKVPTKDNYADLMTKILEPETFTNLRDGMMVKCGNPRVEYWSGAALAVPVGLR